MTSPARTVAALAGLALVGPLAMVGAARAAGPVEEAREATRRVPFSARVEVKWVDQDGLHTAELGVRAVGGTMRINSSGNPGATSSSKAFGTGTIVLQASLAGPLVIGTEGDLLAPAVERKYNVEHSSGPTVAGRETNLFVLRSGGTVREELAIDKATGLVLRRQVFGSEGKPVRIVTVLQLDTAPVPEAADTGSAKGDVPREIRATSLPPAFRGPGLLAGGYRRIAVYRHNQVVHLLYTDGLHGMSLFSQPGTLAAGTLPPGGDAVQVGTASGLHYTWPGGDVVTWQVGSVVHTLVGDGTKADLVAAARSLPRPNNPSLLGRVRGTSRLVAELVSGGR